MRELAIPTLNSNDESYFLVKWLVSDGAKVAEGDDVALIETSKAVTELVAPEDGYLSQRVRAVSECRPGQVVGYLSADQPRGVPVAADDSGPEASDEPASDAEITLTKPARELMDSSGISMEAVAALQKKVIRRADIQSLIGEFGGQRDDARNLSAQQAAVARAVSLSHSTIPAAFSAIKIYSDNLHKRSMAEKSRFVGIPEYVIEAIAKTVRGFPDFTARVGDGLKTTKANSVDIGVTIDMGSGLYVPVVKAADEIGLAGIAAKLMYFRARLLRGKLNDEDLGGSRITLALHQFRDIILAQSIIYPGQVCTLSLGAVDHELWLESPGQVAERSFFYLGISYDHRIVNGRQAAEFLGAIKDSLESDS